jgi:hypothetical protein
MTQFPGLLRDGGSLQAHHTLAVRDEVYSCPHMQPTTIAYYQHLHGIFDRPCHGFTLCGRANWIANPQRLSHHITPANTSFSPAPRHDIVIVAAARPASRVVAYTLLSIERA